MENNTLPLAPTLNVAVNGKRLGMLQSCRERTVSELRTVAAIGTSEIVALLPAKTHYVITFKHLILDRACFPERVALHGLCDFTLNIGDEHLDVCYTGCQFASLSSYNEAGDVLIEEAEIHAASRTVVGE